jgi:hypothetical protein
VGRSRYLKSIWPFWLYVTGRKRDALAVLTAGPYDELPPIFDWIAVNTGEPLMQPRGKPKQRFDFAVASADDFLAHAQFLELLLTDETPAASALAELPGPQEAASLGVWSSWGSLDGFHFSTSVVAMLAHERVGSSEDALACAAIILEASRPDGGSESKLHHSLAHGCRGRILAAQGKAEVAEAGKKTRLLRHFASKMIILPRQARDKHREDSPKR